MEANKIKMLIEMEADDSNMFKMSQEIDPLYLSTRMKNDLVYCQMVLANFLAMHQVRFKILLKRYLFRSTIE